MIVSKLPAMLSRWARKCQSGGGLRGEARI